MTDPKAEPSATDISPSQTEEPAADPTEATPKITLPLVLAGIAMLALGIVLGLISSAKVLAP